MNIWDESFSYFDDLTEVIVFIVHSIKSTEVGVLSTLRPTHDHMIHTLSELFDCVPVAKKGPTLRHSFRINLLYRFIKEYYAYI